MDAIFFVLYRNYYYYIYIYTFLHHIPLFFPCRQVHLGPVPPLGCHWNPSSDIPYLVITWTMTDPLDCVNNLFRDFYTYEGEKGCFFTPHLLPTKLFLFSRERSSGFALDRMCSVSSKRHIYA